MSKWTGKYIQQLQRDGKIRDAVFPAKHKNYSSDKKQNIPAKRSKALTWLDLNLLYWCNDHALTLETEYKFCPDRGWRFDYCMPAIKVAVEYEGGVFLQTSGHNTAKHYTKDTEKYNRAAVLGWRVIRVTAMNYTTVLKTLNEMVK